MTANRRLLYVVNALETDAPTKLTIAAALAAKRKGWQVDLVAWSRKGEAEEQLRENEIIPVVLGKPMLSSAWALHRIIEDRRPQIVHTALARPSLGYALTSAIPLSNEPPLWIAADHGVHEWHEKGKAIGWGMSRLMPAALAAADVVTTVSEDAAAQLRSRGVPADRIWVLPNGVDVRRFYPALRRNRDQLLQSLFPSEQPTDIKFLIGVAGNLRRLKGHDILLRAIPVILKQFPQARFVIWGEGPERAALTALAASLDVTNAVSLPGHETNLEAYLPLLDVYVQPSRIESFGLGAAEAMACGLPVVVSRIGGMPELVVEGITGLTSEPNNPSNLADRIIQLLRNQAKREAIGDAARLHILQHFSQQGMTSAVLALYEQLLQQREAPDERH